MQNRSLKRLKGGIIGWTIGFVTLIALAVLLFFALKGQERFIYITVFSVGEIVFLGLLFNSISKYRYSRVDENSEKIYKANFVKFNYRKRFKHSISIAIEVNYTNENGKTISGMSDYIFKLDDINELKEMQYINVAHKSNGKIIILS